MLLNIKLQSCSLIHPQEELKLKVLKTIGVLEKVLDTILMQLMKSTQSTSTCFRISMKNYQLFAPNYSMLTLKDNLLLDFQWVDSVP